MSLLIPRNTAGNATTSATVTTVAPADGRPGIVHGLQIQDDAQCRINAAHLVEAEEPDALAEPARVDRCGLFGKYPGVYATDFDLRPKACGTS